MPLSPLGTRANRTDPVNKRTVGELVPPPDSREGPAPIYLLRKTTLFQRWPDEALESLQRHVQYRKYSRGQTIIAQQEILEALYAVISGRVEISEVQANGRRYIRRLSGAGRVFGFVSLFDGKGSHHACVAQTPVTIARVARRGLYSALNCFPDLWFSIVTEMSVFQRQMLSSITEMVFEGARPRLVRSLLTLCTLRVSPSGRSASQCVVESTQDELAALLGVSRQTVSKELKALERDGLLTIEYRQIVLLDIEQLRSLIGPA